MEGARRALGRAVVAQAAVRLRRKTLDEISDQPRFPDAGLAAEQHRLPFAALSLRPAARQRLCFCRPARQRDQAACMQGLEAAFDLAGAQHGPGRDRPGDTLEVLRAKVLEL